MRTLLGQSVAARHLKTGNSRQRHRPILDCLILLSTPEFGIVELDDAYCTGSSIMPQKKNPDALEVIKGKAVYTRGMVVALSSLGSALFAGYNRDSQWSKYPVMDVIDV